MKHTQSVAVARLAANAEVLTDAAERMTKAERRVVEAQAEVTEARLLGEKITRQIDRAEEVLGHVTSLRDQLKAMLHGTGIKAQVDDRQQDLLSPKVAVVGGEEDWLIAGGRLDDAN